MGQQHGATEEVDRFLEDVADQIQYKPIREEIKEELVAHLEDSKDSLMQQGVEEQSAWRKAVAQMGDAVEIGFRINEVRSQQKCTSVVTAVFLLITLGMLGNVREAVIEKSDFPIYYYHYFIWGMLLFSLIYQVGFEKLAKHGRNICYFIIGVWSVLFFLWFTAWRTQHIFGNFPSITIPFALELLSIPMVVMIAYSSRGYIVRATIATTCITGGIIAMSSRMVSEYSFGASLILLLSVSATCFFIHANGGTKKSKLKNMAITGLGFFVTIHIFLFSYIGSWNSIIMQCFEPEKVATDHWDDSYNSILIKELLVKGKVVGSISLNQEERTKYYTSQWYFEQVEESYIQYKMQFVKDGQITLEQILPQHYQNNDRIAYWVLKYGWIPASCLIVAILFVYGLLAILVYKINNRLGKAIAFSCSIALVLQFLLYLAGNFGYQFGWFCTFPFVSEGFSSITVNAIFAGLLCSAYRYDKVIKKENLVITKNNRMKLL